jgi:hypothetical protein
VSVLYFKYSTTSTFSPLELKYDKLRSSLGFDIILVPYESASCDVYGCTVSGGTSHAVLCDAGTLPRFGGATRIEAGPRYLIV